MTSAAEQLVPNKFCDGLDNFIKALGHVVMWTNGFLVIAIIVQVVARYGFGHGQVWLEETQWHLYAVGIMFGASYAQVLDSHIRVDILYARLSYKWRLRWNLFGLIVLMLPFCAVIFEQSLDFVWEAWRTSERSDAPMGLPARWLIKSVIPISFGLLILASISQVVRIASTLRSLGRA
jgi:TRAP-type mannitol/chloroaromatic compound transport system permease small subunit